MKVTVTIKFLILVTLLLCSAEMGWSQTGYEDVVYLKNGGIMRGMIIEQVPNQSLKIETVGRNVFVYRFEEIEKIVKEPTSASKPTKAKDEEPEAMDRGRFTFILESNSGFNFGAGGQSAGLASGNNASFGLGLAFGVNLHPKLSLGLGGGADRIGGTFFFPIFLDVRYFFSNKPVTPYLSFSGGWAIGQSYKIEGDNPYQDVSVTSDGGIYLNPNMGIRINIAPKAALNFGLGARIQGSNGRIKVGYLSDRYSALLTLVNVKIGAIF